MHDADRKQALRHARHIIGGALVAGLLSTSAGAYALSVQTLVIGTLQGDSNFSDPTRSVSEFEVRTETPVPGSLPPLLGTVQGIAQANGETGTLRVRVGVTNPGPGLGILPGATLEMQASMSETFLVSLTSGGGTRRPGIAGIGTSGDGLITIRATGTLLGFGSIGGATGVPSGVDAFNAGSTRAQFSLVLAAGGNSLRRGLTITETTNLEGPTSTTTGGTGSTILGTVTAEGNTVTMNLDESRYFALSDRRILFEASLTAFARGGRYSGSEVFANYNNSAYLDLDIEQGYFWQPGIASNRNFLANPATPPSSVPVPAALPLLGSALGLLAMARKTRAQG